MTLAEYFEDQKGTGVLSTSDAEGNVDAAIYSRPHFLSEDDTVLTWIMADHKSHANLQANPKVCFLFMEEGPGYRGKRLYLTKSSEEQDPEKIKAVSRKPLPCSCNCEDGKQRFLVHFKLDKERPLIGDS